MIYQSKRTKKKRSIYVSVYFEATLKCIYLIFHIIFFSDEIVVLGNINFHNKEWLDPQQPNTKGERQNHSPSAIESRILSPSQPIFLVFFLTIPVLMIYISRVALSLTRRPVLLPLDAPIKTLSISRS